MPDYIVGRAIAKSMREISLSQQNLPSVSIVLYGSRNRTYSSNLLSPNLLEAFR